MSLKGTIYASISSFNTYYNFNQVVNKLATEMTLFLCRGKHTTDIVKLEQIRENLFRQEDITTRLLYDFRDCLLQCIIVSNVRTVIDIVSSTAATTGVPSYLLCYVDEEEYQELSEQNAMVVFGRGLDSY